LDHRFLLDRVREFVSDQFFSAGALRLELVSAEKDVFADGEGVRTEMSALLGGRGVSVDADVGKACAEPPEMLTRGVAERAGAAGAGVASAR
jgi:hypothetical protein